MPRSPRPTAPISYAAFLGHQPQISLAELAAALPGFTLEHMVGRSVALVSCTKNLTQDDVDLLGGTVLLARKIDGAYRSTDDIPRIVAAETAGVKGKITFALRGAGTISPALIHLHYRATKQLLKGTGRAVRYIGNEQRPAASALLRDAGLIDGSQGCEIVVITDADFCWIGRTVATQDPDAYTERDMEKPVRDTRAGLLPPKLAQILLNLGSWAAREAYGKEPSPFIVLDPFCGTGVIPLEALIRGWHVLASDSSQKAVTGCETNLEWIRKKRGIKKREVPSTVTKHDARKPFALKQAPTVVVTETMLGPALKTQPTAKDARSIRSACEDLEIAFLKNARATLPGVPLVVTFPVWRLRTGPLPLERTWKALPAIGYTPVLPPGITAEHPERPSLLYNRNDQLVGREIVILQPGDDA